MNECKFPGCGRMIRAVKQGLCQTHERQRKAGRELKAIGARGFAQRVTEDRAAFLEMSRLAGQRAHKLGKAHVFTTGAEAIEAGRRGGSAPRKTAGSP